MTFSLYAMTFFPSFEERPTAPPEAVPCLVRRPLNALEIDPLLRHLVERRQLAKLDDLPDHQLGDVVDLFLGVEAAESEADRGVRHLLLDADRAQHVGRLER